MKYITFDCYGTLVDWEEGIYKTLSKYIDADREIILQVYAKVESKLEKHYKPYKDILVEVMDTIAKKLRIEDYDRNALLKSFYEWKPFDDVNECLGRIRKKYKIAIISNVDEDMFEHTLKLLGVEFDEIILAEHVKAYKPDIRVFEYALKKLGTKDILHVAQSCYHDIIPARKMGIKTALIVRRGFGATPRVNCKPRRKFKNLKELCEFLEV